MENLRQIERNVNSFRYVGTKGEEYDEKSHKSHEIVPLVTIFPYHLIEVSILKNLVSLKGQGHESRIA